VNDAEFVRNGLLLYIPPMYVFPFLSTTSDITVSYRVPPACEAQRQSWLTAKCSPSKKRKVKCRILIGVDKKQDSYIYRKFTDWIYGRFVVYCA
jgi:hypothetical protein